MPIISATAISPHRIGGKNWSSYWATLISAVIENAAPTNVVLTFPTAKTELKATDIACTVNGVARTVSSASWTGAVWTIVLASSVEYADVVVMTFAKTGQTTAVINNALTYVALLTSTGTGVGVPTLRMRVSANITVTLGANAKFYSDAAGTLDESATWSLTAGALRTIYLKCTTGTATMTFSDITKVTGIGDLSNDGYFTPANAPRLDLNLNKVKNLVNVWMSGRGNLTGNPPNNIILLYLTTNPSWSYMGALPSMVDYLNLGNNNIAWTHSSNLPSLNVVTLNGTSINWTGLGIESGSNIITLSLLKYRTAKMSSADMITLLTQLTNRTGALPATVTINDYADYASPPAEVVAAVNTLKAAKSITTVNLGA